MMKQMIYILILLAITSHPTLAAPNNTNGPVGVNIESFTNLSSASYSPTTTGKAIVIDKIVSADSLTITNSNLKFIKGGGISVASGKTVTINSSIEAGQYQIFYGPGKVVGLQWVWGEWFGAVGDNSTDNTSALQKAVNAIKNDVGIVNIGNGIFKFSAISHSNIDAKITLRGQGYQNTVNSQFGSAEWLSPNPSYKGTILKSAATTGNAIAFNSYQGANLENIMIVGPGAGTSTGVYMMDSMVLLTQNHHWSNVMVANFYNGIKLPQVYNSHFDSLEVYGCSRGIDTGPASNQNIFTNLHVQSFSVFGIKFDNSDTNIINGFLGQSYFGNAIYLNGATNVIVKSSYCESAKTTGTNNCVYMNGGSTFTMENAHFSGLATNHNDSIRLVGTAAVRLKNFRMFNQAKLFDNGNSYNLEIDDSVVTDSSVVTSRVIGDIGLGYGGGRDAVSGTNSGILGSIIRRFEHSGANQGTISIMKSGVSASEWQVGTAFGVSHPFGQYSFYARNMSSGMVLIIGGNGDPNGNVSAPVGSLYTRKDGGSNSTLYVKTSGTGARGWTAK